MKAKLKTILLTALSVFTAAAAASATFAWFFSSVSLPDYDYLGQSAGAYFESGSGTYDNPFIISRPRHLYNLAWLQDMGAFNRQALDENNFGVVDSEGNPVIQQYYFKVKPTLQEVGLDMNGVVIPPIGTEQYPFLGNFDGSGVVISNFTISNSFADYHDNHPNIVSNFTDGNSGVNQPHIVGFFGVVGAKGSVNYSYSPGVNELYNFALDDFEVKTVTNTSLVGLAVGYLNGPTENVAIKSGDLTIGTANTNKLDSNITDNLSDYSVIGYATDEYKTIHRKYQQLVYGADVENSEFTASDEGNTVGGGGSVNMTDLYKRLYNVVNAGSEYTDSNKMYYSYVNTYSADWKTITSSERDENKYFTSNLKYYHADDEMGNFEFLTASNDSYQFLYLTGGHYESASFYDNFYRITDGENFLTCTSIANNAGVNNTTTENDAIVWAVPAKTTGYIYTMHEGDPYYLTAVGTSLSLVNNSSNATTWTKEIGDNDKIRYSYNGNSIICENGTWKLSTVPDITRPDDPIVYLPEGDPVTQAPDPISVPEPGVVSETGTYQMSFTYNGTTYYIHSNSDKSGIEAKTTLFNPGWTLNPNNSTTTISTSINGTTYYLNKTTQSSDAPVLGTGNSTTWTVDGSKFYVTLGGIACIGGTDYYIANSGTTFSCNQSGSNYTCSACATYKDQFMLLTTANAQYQADEALYRPEKERYDAELEIYNAWNTYYNYRDNVYPGLWSTYQTAIETYYNTYNITLNNITDEHPWAGDDTYLNGDKATTGMAYTGSDTTYFPLNVIKDGDKKTSFADYKPLDSNTGYMIIGGNYNGLTGSNPSAQGRSLMRVSRYEISNISGTGGSYNTSSKTLGTVYTMNENLDIVSNPNELYENYSKNAEKLTAVLRQDNSNVYGLHFLDSLISMDSLVEAKKVKIGSVDYTENYQLPVNSIDFKLLEKGYINFFAGMYFRGSTGATNDSFFSLHHIRRNDDNTIRQIKEISEVYSDGIDNHSYVYEYTDGKFSKAFQYEPTGGKVDFDNRRLTTESMEELQIPTSYIDPSGIRRVCTYTPVFNTERIENYRGPSGNRTIVNSNLSYSQHQKHIFYYEIPMNEGEFALGSVDGGTGGYLFYLDIGANAKKVNRTTFLQHFKSTLQVMAYPHGVAFEDVSVGSTISVTNGDGAFIALLPLYQDTLSLTRVDNGVYIQDGYNSTYVKGRFEQTGITMYSGAPPDTSTEINIDVESSTVEIWRLETYDFNNANQSITRSIIDVTYIDGILQDRIAKQYYNDNLVFDTTSSNAELTNEDNATFYIASDGVGQSRRYTEIVVAESGTIVNTEIGKIVVEGDNITIGGFTIDLTASKGDSTVYHTGDGYTITINDVTGSPSVTATPGTSLPTGYTSITIVVNGYVVTISGMSVAGS